MHPDAGSSHTTAGAHAVSPPATVIRTTRFTSRPAARVIDDLGSIDVPGALVVERGDGYLVYAPTRGGYGLTTAVALTIALVLVVLVLTAYVVVVIALLPLAALPLLPLILDRRPTLAVGAADLDQGRAQLTVHGQTWGELAAAIDVYLANLPPAAAEPAPAVIVDLPGEAARRVG